MSLRLRRFVLFGVTCLGLASNGCWWRHRDDDDRYHDRDHDHDDHDHDHDHDGDRH